MIRTTAIIVLALNLGACATLQKEPLAQGELRAETQALDAPASWVFGKETDGQIARNWTSVLVDPLLASLIAEALRNNPSMRGSAQSVARAEALFYQARSNLLPNLSASLSPSVNGALEGESLSDSYSAGLSASWEADIWGGIRAGVLASGYDLMGTRATFEGARQALIASVARAYILAIEADLQIEMTQQTLIAQEETLRIVKVRYDLGAASRREVVLAESDVAGARDNLAVVKSAKTDAVLALQTLLGEYPDGNLGVAQVFPEIADTVNAGAPVELLRRRPDVISAEFGVLSAFYVTRSTRAEKWPSLSLSGSLDSRADNLADLFDPVAIAYSLGLRLADTLFDGGLTQARIDAANANQKQALANYGQTLLDAYADAESSLNTVETLKERAEYIRQSADAAREALALAEVQYKEGAIDLLDVLIFRQRSFQADRTQITVQRQSIEARIALYLALGGSGVAAETTPYATQID